MNRVHIKSEMLRWARERAGLTIADLEKRFPRLGAWEQGHAAPTLKQLERYAKATYAPVGYFFLQTPPDERVPIPDLRTVGNARIANPSPDLLDTVYICQQRQDWFREFARSNRQDPLSFVGSAATASNVTTTAASIRLQLGFGLEEQQRAPTWTDALRSFIMHADEAGILVMCSGVVLNNNRRRLQPDEFRGFAIADELAPLVFINGADSKAAQMFTLAHELAHIWLGESALSDVQAISSPDHEVEKWCNQVAAELLVPMAELRRQLSSAGNLETTTQRLARRFKVSNLVILRRMHDVGALSRDELGYAYSEELDRLDILPKSSGGSFYLTQAARVSKRFARSLVVSTLEGQTLHRDAFRLLGFSKLDTFRELGRNLGVDV